ncbi:hypothetical protein KQ873_00155 [Mycoplasma zalophidermidis]|uniref:MSC_0621 family F1-like ATPase epsilon subunit n=1 Tax=Mycoplasma zalophidermidis TaxID=398174 RepID=UPI001C10B80E|nr:hypothetical protein [Mycoplasma zalophidermidis]MBU4689454.1 hypothetical protein [Mycoplasma zalophidermidis]
MEKQNNIIKVVINSLANIPLVFNKCILYLNVNDENNWKLISDKALASFDKTIIKIEDYQRDETFFCFLYNTNIVLNNKTASINSFSKIVLYKINKQSSEQVENKKMYKKITNEINYLTSAQSIGLLLDEAIKLDKLKTKQYEYKMKMLLSLETYEGDYYE